LSAQIRTEGFVSKENIARWLARPLKPISIAEVPELAASLGTTIGNVRSENQDRAIVARFTSARCPGDSFLCFALCDGMGGMADGARCAEVALSSFLFRLTHREKETAPQLVRTAALAANSEVNREFRERGGTTLVAIVVFPESAAAVSVGDSRIYLSTLEKDVKQVTVDDTIAGELNKLKGFEPRSGSNTFADQLAQFVGIGEGMEPRIYPIDTDLTYVLTSDGAHNTNPDTFSQIVSYAGTPQLIVTRLLHLSRWCGGADNATAICVPRLRSDWSVPPTWANGDWLEIWDSVGKLELQAKALSTSLPKAGEIPRRTESTETKAKRSKKRSQGAHKKESGLQKANILPASAQGSLKIEIVDERPTQTTPEDPTPQKSTAISDQSGKPD
jgi:PPM family protein phosphatase